MSLSDLLGQTVNYSSVRNTQDVKRVRALPHWDWHTDTQDLTARYAKLGGTMRLRPIQSAMLACAEQHRGGFFPARTGAGKLLVSLLLFQAVGAKRGVLIVPASRRVPTHQAIRDLGKHWRFPPFTTITYSDLSQANNHDLLTRLAPDCVVCDECFQSGTKIRTPTGDRNIEDIAVGDEITSALGTERVVRLFRGLSDTWVRIRTAAGDLTCTGSHPILTDRGWTKANDITQQDRIVFSVPQGTECAQGSEVLQSGMFKDSSNAPEADVSVRCTCKQGAREILFECLQGTETAHTARTRNTFDFCAVLAQAEPRSPQQGDVGEQPYVECGMSGQDATDSEGHGTQAIGAHGERLRSDRDREPSSIGTWRRVGAQPNCSDRPSGSRHRVSEPLQARCGACELARVLRAGRGITPVSKQEGAGLAQGCIPETFRLGVVESVERVYERAATYNIETSVSHTYIANNAVVHNCHSLKDSQGARWRRVSRVSKDVPFFAMSGSFANRDLSEWRHLAVRALGEKAPVPLSHDAGVEWSRALNPRHPAPLDPGALLTLMPDGEDVREIFGRRLISAPGVVSSGHDIPDIPLSFSAVTLPATREMRDVENHMLENWLTPCEWPIDTAVDMWRHLRELSHGLYYRWRDIPPPVWLERRKEYSAFIREHTKGNWRYDLPTQVRGAVRSGYIHDEGGVCARWEEVEPSYVPVMKPVWLEDSTLEYAAEWAKQDTSQGIIWVSVSDFGERLAKLTGLPYFRQGAEDANGVHIEMHRGVCIASVASCSTGHNLQHHRRNLVLSVPSPIVLEQLISRTHRDGQEHAVHVEFLLRLKSDLDQLEKAKVDAESVSKTFHVTQRLLFGDWT